MGYDGDSFRQKIIVPAIESVIRINGKKILDAGCGEGFLTRRMARNGAREVVGIDFSERLLAHAQRKAEPYKIKFQQSDIENIDLRVGHNFDLCFCINVLMDITSPAIAMMQMTRILKTGGFLIVIIPHPKTFRPHDLGLRLWKARKVKNLGQEVIYTVQMDEASPVRTYYFYRPEEFYTSIVPSSLLLTYENDLMTNNELNWRSFVELNNYPIFKLFVWQKVV